MNYSISYPYQKENRTAKGGRPRDVRERIMKIRIIEKMKEPELKAYGDKLGIKDISYTRVAGARDPGIRKIR